MHPLAKNSKHLPNRSLPANVYRPKVYHLETLEDKQLEIHLTKNDINTHHHRDRLTSTRDHLNLLNQCQQNWLNYSHIC